jgi:hypothetical protein
MKLTTWIFLTWLSTQVNYQKKFYISYAFEVLSSFTSYARLWNWTCKLKKIDEDYNLDIFDMIVDTSELIKELINKK